MCLDIMIEIEPAIIISVFALIVSGTTSIAAIYYLHWQGPVFRIQLLFKETTTKATNATTFEYFFVLVNNGNKTGIIKKLTSKTPSDVKITREEPKVIRGKDEHPIDETEPYLAVGIGPKETVIIKCKFTVYAPENQLPNYLIKFVVDKNVKHEKLSDNDKKEIIIDKE